MYNILVDLAGHGNLAHRSCDKWFFILDQKRVSAALDPLLV